jgi:hypothetical protein
MTRFCNNREERVNHYTQPGYIFNPPTEGGLDTTLQVTSKDANLDPNPEPHFAKYK